MKSWIPWSLLALLSWGFWGLFPKLATNYISPRSAILYESLGAALAGLVALLSIGAPREANSRGILFGVLTGLCAFTGAWFYVNAVSKGKLSLIVTVTAMYPVITVIFARLVLGESITVRHGIGMLFAFVAIVLLVT